MTSYTVFSAGVGPISRKIIRITGGPASHVLKLFSDGSGFEAHYEDGGWVRTSYGRLRDWESQAAGRRFWHIPVATGADAVKILAKCEGQLGLWQYNRHQLLQLWANLRLRLPVPQSWRVTCSEAAGKVDFDATDWCALCGLKPQRFDRLTPANMMEAVRSELKDGLPEMSI